jgi:hypothetical protein
MRKTVVLLLSAAFVATLPSIASAKKIKHPRQRQAVVVQAYNDDSAGLRFLGAALHQFIVPLEVTFAPRQY